MSKGNDDGESGLLEALAYMLASDLLEDPDELEAELAELAGGGDSAIESLLEEARTKIAQQRRESLGDEDGVDVADDHSAYADVSGEELDHLWSARVGGLDGGEVAVAHRELRGVGDHDKRTMHRDLDLLDEEETTNGDD